MGEKKKKSVKMILFSLLLILVGIVLLVLAVERIKSGWYRMHYKVRPARHEGFAVMLPVILILLGCFNLYRGLRGKVFQMDISNMFSSHEDGSPYSCPHCGAQLQPGQFACRICGKRIL